MRVAVSTTTGIPPASSKDRSSGLRAQTPGLSTAYCANHVETIAEDGISDGYVGDAFADFIHDSRSLDPDA